LRDFWFQNIFKIAKFANFVTPQGRLSSEKFLAFLQFFPSTLIFFKYSAYPFINNLLIGKNCDGRIPLNYRNPLGPKLLGAHEKFGGAKMVFWQNGVHHRFFTFWQWREIGLVAYYCIAYKVMHLVLLRRVWKDITN